MAGYNFAGKFGLKPYKYGGRVRGAGSSESVSDEENITGQPLAEVEIDRKYGPIGSKSRAYYQKMKGAEMESSRKFSKDWQEQQQKQSKLQFDKEKEFVGKWTELVLKARETGDTTLQKHLLSYGRDYIETLSYGTRQLLEPIIRAGPFDPAKAKLEKYDELNPAPGITADREKQPLLFAQQAFAEADHRAARTHYATGQTPPRVNLMPYGDQKDGRYMSRDTHGNVSIITEGDMQIQDFAKKYGTTVGEVLSNNGAAKGKETSIMINGKLVKVRPSTDFSTRETTLDYLPGFTPEQFRENERKLGDFLAVYSSDDKKLQKKHTQVQAVKAMEEKGVPFDQIAERILKPEFGLNFRKLPEAGFWDRWTTSNKELAKNGYATSDGVNIAYWPGEKDKLNLPNGEKLDVYFDRADNNNIGTVYSPKGRRLGSPEEAVATIMEEQRRTQKEKQKEEEMKALEQESEKKRYGSDKSSLSLDVRRPIGYYGGQKYVDIMDSNNYSQSGEEY